MKIRIQVNRNNTIVALYTTENESQEPEHIFSMSAYSKDPTETVTPSLTGVSNNGYPLAVFTEPTIPHFFWIRENSGLNGNFILLTASDSTSMSGYLRTAFQGISFMPMKPGAFMAVFMHHWAESCTVGIPPEPKQAIDLACADKSDSRYMLESLHLFETEASTIPALVQSLHWFPYLCDLTIHGCNVTDEEAVPIINSLILNPYLKSLAMPANQLSSGSVLAIQSLLSRPSKRLMILDISHNPFPAKSANAILESLANNTCVKRFSMLGVPLTHKSSILSLTQLLERNHSLFCLRLQVALQKTTSETMMAPIFNALMNNITINLLDLGLPSDSATRTNMDILVERNARGASSLTLAGWVSEPWAKLLEFVPTKTEHFQLMLRAAEEKNGVTWKGVSSFTGTLEEGPTGTLNINSEGIFFTPSPDTPHLHLTHPQTSNSTSAPQKIFHWSSTLKIGQLTTEPVLLVFYDPAKFPDPLVITLPTASQVLEVVLCLNSLESCGIAKSSSSNSNSSNSAAPASVKPGQRNRSHAVRTNDELPTIESLLDFSKVSMGDLLAPAGGSGTEVRIACLNGFECCVKIMDCSQYGQDVVDSMEKEISLLIMLKQSKQIVQYLHHDKSGHQLRLYMELFPTSLRKTIKSRAESQTPFTAQQVYILARKILKGLRFLHTQPQPIVHRDIKSDNVLVEEDLSGNFLRVKLTDFGSAKILTRGRTSSIDQGTSGYQAPEMVRSDNSSTVGSGVSSAAHAGSNGGNDTSSGQLSYTTAVDIFSFGITLYEILALQKVYPNCNSRQELEEALRNAEKYPPDFQLVPRQLLHFLLIVSPCLKRNYVERPTAAELIVELDKLATGLGLKKQPSLPPPSSFKSRPKAALNTGSSTPSSPSTVNSIRK
jgi:serine/threonine protein kinase